MKQPAALAAFLLASAACGGTGGLPPEKPPLVRGPEGRPYHLLDKGQYKGYYDPWGRLQRLEYDSNNDKRPDHVAYHRDGARFPHLIEVDADFDGVTDRWEEYDEQGKLTRVGERTRPPGPGAARPDLYTTRDPAGGLRRREFDEDHDGRVERTENYDGTRMTGVEIDGDRDGRADRWQSWQGGMAVSEDIDTDGDGRPDRRLRYGPRGQVKGVEALDGSR